MIIIRNDDKTVTIVTGRMALTITINIGILVIVVDVAIATVYRPW